MRVGLALRGTAASPRLRGQRPMAA